MAKKGNIRSIRFSDEIIELIESQEGENFTAKFERLVRRCVQELPEKERQLEITQQAIRQEGKRLDRIRRQANELEINIRNMSNNLEYYSRQAKRAIENLESLIQDV